MKIFFIVQVVLCVLIVLCLLLFKCDGVVYCFWVLCLVYGLVVFVGVVIISVFFGWYDWVFVVQNGLIVVLCIVVYVVCGNVVELFCMGGVCQGWFVCILWRFV